MKIYRVLLVLLNIYHVKPEDNIKLYKIGRTERYGEFSNLDSLKSVERDINRIPDLPPYK